MKVSIHNPFFSQWIELLIYIKQIHKQLLFYDLNYFWNLGAGIECLLAIPELEMDYLWDAGLQLNQRNVPGICS